MSWARNVWIFDFLEFGWILALLTMLRNWLWLFLRIMLWKTELRGLSWLVTGRKTQFFTCEKTNIWHNRDFFPIRMDFGTIHFALILTFIFFYHIGLKEWEKGIIFLGNRQKNLFLCAIWRLFFTAYWWLLNLFSWMLICDQV